MAKIDENFFKYGSDQQMTDIENIISIDEVILWRGKPNKKAFIINSIFKMLPFALIWLLFDGAFIAMFIASGFTELGIEILFFIIFFAFHLLPVWIWLGNILTASKRHKNIEYAFTEKRIIVKSGIIGIDFKNIYYSEIDSVNLKVGAVDKMLNVGDIYIKSKSQATILQDLENPYFLTQKLQEIVFDIKSDIIFPNNLRPEENHGYNTKYKK